MNNLVSVIIPTFNREKYIDECINSVIAQTYRPIEIIVIDDGSFDNTVSVLNQINKEIKSKPDSRISFKFISQENGGAQKARNRGIDLSTGDFIIFLDSDDLLIAEKIEKQVSEIIKTGCDIVYSPNIQIDENGKILGTSCNRPLTGTYLDYVRHSWYTISATYLRSYIEKIGLWNEELTINQDYEYCLRAVLAGGRINFLNEYLQVYRCHNDEKIGSQKINYNLVKSKETIAKLIYHIIVEKGFSDSNLKRMYYKKFLLCIIFYGILRKKKEQKDLWIYLMNNFQIKKPLRILGSIFSSYWISVLSYEIYSFNKKHRFYAK